MNDMKRIHDEHLRLTILRLLAGQAGYSANDSVLTMATEAMGLHCTRDQMRGHLAWLEEQRLVTTVNATPRLMVAELTERGNDVAAGRSFVAGVQRPSPGE